MTRMRSPSYPSVSMRQAIELTRKIFDKSRTNAVDREAAAKDMGYSGITGRSLKVLAALIQYNLLEKAGKGGVRVTQTFKDIVHGLTDEIKKNALLKAGTSPVLFQELLERFQDGPPSENALKSYLIQCDFADVAIGPAVSSFLATYRELEDANVFDSHGTEGEEGPESTSHELKVDDAVSQTTMSSPEMGRPTLQVSDAISASSEVNKINMNIRGNQVQVNALLDYKGLLLLEKKIAGLKALLEADEEDWGQNNH